MSDGTSDAELIRRIAAGGPDARAAEDLLCKRYAPRVRLYGLRHLRNEDRARDLVQAALLGVLEAARGGRIADVDKLDRFVLGTSRNVALRMREHDGRAEPRPHEELDSIAVDHPEPLDREALMRCIDLLEGRARMVVHLTYNEERSADEIATSLATSAGNVRVLRHRAIAALRSCLDGKQASS